MNILVDVDDTLTNFLQERNQLIKKYIEDNKLPYKILDINCIQSANIADWPLEECCKFWKKIGKKAQMQCHSKVGCQEVLRKLREKGHNIIIVSARPDMYFPAIKYTTKWLKKHKIPYDDLIVDKRDKKQTIIDNNIELVIDDSIQTITYAIDLNIDSFMFTTNENKKFVTPKGCVRVSEWKEVESVLIDRNIL